MVRGLYTAYTGMVNSQHRLDVVSNNLANATTTGYKKEGCTTQSFDAVYGINWEQGSFVTTDNTYDFALSGKGFFTISFTNKAGETSTMYTRDGSFQMNADGYLVTKDGDYVLGESGEPIVLPTDATNIAVEPTGEIYADNEYVDSFLLTDFEDYNYLEMYGENLYRAIDGATQADEVTATVNQGFKEASNINVVSEMVEMISIAREYESGQKVINAMDEMMSKMVSISEL